MKVCTKGGIQNTQSVNLEITGLHEILGQDYGLKEWGLLFYAGQQSISLIFSFLKLCI